MSLVPSVTETIIAMGAGDRLIARTRYDEQQALADLPSLGGGLDPNLEFLTVLEPDLVILFAEGGQGTALGDRLAALGMEWYGVRVETVADFERTASNLGKLAGLEARADSLVAHAREQFAAAGALWLGQPMTSVVYLVQHDPLMVAGPGTFVDSVLAAAGADNVFGDARDPWPVVSLEQVVWRDPAFVIVPAAGDGPVGAAAAAARLAEAPGWRAVPAVGAGRVVAVDAALFSRPGPRMGEAAVALATLLRDRSPDPSSGGGPAQPRP